MALFSDILLTADFDRTLTAPDSTVPQRNIEAIRYFIDNGGAFTVNTGRSVPMTKVFRDVVPVNAPLLLYNGSAAYDLEKGEFTFCHLIDADMGETVRFAMAQLPDMITEIQGAEAHYTFTENPVWHYFNKKNGCRGQVVAPGDDIGPFIKMCVYGPLQNGTVAGLFSGTEEEIRRCDEAEILLREAFGEKMTVLRVAPRIIDFQAPGVSKGTAARELLKKLGRKILVCVGDERNDLTMMDEADYSYCPADGAIADRYETVCSCAEGAVADVIYKKIPEILEIRP
jgi:hydroxymethylpyrimidine pyrophosphatase-like HAD family hydrolase